MLDPDATWQLIHALNNDLCIVIGTLELLLARADIPIDLRSELEHTLTYARQAAERIASLHTTDGP